MTDLVTETEDADRTVGAWEAAFVGWRVFVPVVLANAGLQALLVRSDPVPALTTPFVLLLLGSVAAVVVAVWLVVGAAAATVDGRPAWRAAVGRPVVLGWLAGLGLVAVAASLLTVWLLPVVLAVGGFLLPPAATGESVVAGVLRTWRHDAIRSAVLLVVALVVAALSAVVALLLGLFVTGWLSAGLLWLWLGAVTVILLCRYCVVAARARG